MDSYTLDPRVCPSSFSFDEDDNKPNPEPSADNCHKWDRTTDPVICAECGTERDSTNVLFQVINCLLCGSELEHQQVNETHIFKCPDCPFIGFEYYRAQNMIDLAKSIN